MAGGDEIGLEIGLGHLAVLEVANKLSGVLIEEYGVLGGAARHVEWIERELRSMQGRLEHEQHGYEQEPPAADDDGGVMKELEDIAKEAEDVIKTFIMKSVKRRRTGVLYWYDKHKVSKELEHIRERMGNISHKIMNLNTITVETPVESSSSSTTTNTVAGPAIEKLDYILSQNLIAGDVVMVIKIVKNELHDIQNFVFKSTTSGEREKLWLEEVKSVCELTVKVATEFISKRERSWLKRGTAKKFEKVMEHIHTQNGDILRRWLTYGVGLGEGERDKQTTTAARTTPDQNLSLEHIIKNLIQIFFLLPVSFFASSNPFFFMAFFMLWAILYKVANAIVIERGGRTESKKKKKKKKKMTMIRMMMMMMIRMILGILFFFIIFLVIIIILLAIIFIIYTSGNKVILVVIFSIPIFCWVIVWTVNLWSSVDKTWKCVQRDLAMMRAFLRETESTAEEEGLNERQKVWMGQLRDVAQNTEFFVAAYRSSIPCLRRVKYALDMNRLLKEILDISDRKSIYGIADIQVTEDGERNPPPTPAAAAMAASAYRYRPVMWLKVRIQSIREEMELMNALERDAEAVVGELRGGGGALDGRSKIWVEQMKGIADEAESVINDFVAKLEHRSILVYIFKLWTQVNISNKLYDIEDKIRDAWRRRKAYGLVQLQTRSESMVQILRQPSYLVGKESSSAVADAQVLMTQLLSNEPEGRCITCITGISGTGKTRLANMIFHDKAVVDHFKCRVWLSPHSMSSSTPILEEIANQAIQQQIMGGGDSISFDQIEVLQALARSKYLIVVDGMETPLHVLDTLKDAMPDMSTACRILLTSRNVKVAQHDHEAGSRTFVHPQHLLDDESSWMLFTRYLEVDIPLELEDLGNKIVLKCGGLPSEILKVSNLLSRKVVTQEEWSAVLGQIQHWPVTLDTINTNLPNYLRRCLFYFVLFPAEFQIPVRRLVALWTAEGLVVSRVEEEEEEPQEQVAEKYLSQLIDANVVQIAKRKRNGKVKTCRIPTALRQQLNANPDNSIKRWVADHLDERDVWHNHIHGAVGDDSSSKYNSPSFITNYENVRTLLSFDTREGSKPGQEIGNFLTACISSNCLLLVRMLDLEGVYKPKLPETIARLSQLKYLGLRWTYSESLPSSISSLLKLQTLDLKHTYIHILPSSIWKMELRHLFLSETFRSRFPPQPKHNTLSDLQTLWGLFVDEETPVKGGFDTLLKIRKLGIACQSMMPQNEKAMEDQLKAVVDWITKLEHLRSLRLKSRNEEGHPSHLPIESLEKNINLTNLYLAGSLSSSSSILSKFPLSLIELTLSHSKLEDDPMQMLKEFPCLQTLCLLADSCIRKSMVCESKSFPKLLVLKLWKLEQLEEWKIEEGALPNLKQLEIRSCKSLTMRPHGLEHVVNILLEVKLTNMPKEISDDIRTIFPNCQVD